MPVILEFEKHYQLRNMLGKLDNIGSEIYKEGKKEFIKVFFKDTGELISRVKYPPEKWTAEKFVGSGYANILDSPIKASTPTNRDKVESNLDNPEWFMQHKIDGVRARFYVGNKTNRIFGGSITKSGFYAEYTDNIPHLRELELPKAYKGTVLDGELVHPSGIVPDRKTPGVVNALPETAWRNQLENGWLVYIAYDITSYKGIDVRGLPYKTRIELLEDIMYGNNDAPWHECFIPIITVQKSINLDGEHFTKRSYLNYIFDNGYEGGILKDPESPYEHKKTSTNIKVKLEKTYDVIIIGATEPNKYYTNPSTGKEDPSRLTKYYAEGMIGAVQYGIIATSEEAIKIKAAGGTVVKKLAKNKILMNIGQCSGMNDEARKEFTRGRSMTLKDKYLLKVMEVKANGIVDLAKGTLRHPRFIRMRPDKDYMSCTFKAHLVSS